MTQPRHTPDQNKDCQIIKIIDLTAYLSKLYNTIHCNSALRRLTGLVCSALGLIGLLMGFITVLFGGGADWYSNRPLLSCNITVNKIDNKYILHT